MYSIYVEKILFSLLKKDAFRLYLENIGFPYLLKRICKRHLRSALDKAKLTFAKFIYNNNKIKILDVAYVHCQLKLFCIFNTIKLDLCEIIHKQVI